MYKRHHCGYVANNARLNEDYEFSKSRDRIFAEFFQLAFAVDFNFILFRWYIDNGELAAAPPYNISQGYTALEGFPAASGGSSDWVSSIDERHTKSYRNNLILSQG